MPKDKNSSSRNVKHNFIFKKLYKKKLEELKESRKKIITQNNWSQAKFYRKLNGIEQASKEELKVIIDILK